MNRYNAKKCKSCGKAVSVVAVRTAAKWRDDHGTNRAVFVNEAGVAVGVEHVLGGDATIIVKCPCGRNRVATMVCGKFSAEHVCGAKCLNATGHDCECSCGGKNHGAGNNSSLAFGNVTPVAAPLAL